MFRHVQRTRPDRKSSENEFLGTLDASPFTVKNNGFERFGKIKKKTRFRSMCFIDQSRLRPAGTRAGASGPLPFTAPAHKSFLDRTGVGAHLRCLRITLKGTTLRKNGNKKNTFQKHVFYRSKWRWIAWRVDGSAATFTLTSFLQ